MAGDEPQFIDDDHANIVTFAETYFDDEEERSEFVNTLMERRGYTRVESWGPAAEPPAAPRQRGGHAPRQPRQQAPRRSPYFKNR